MKKGAIGLLAAGLLAAMSPTQATVKTVDGQTGTENRNAIPFERAPVRPQMERNVHGSFGNTTDKPSRFLNQRQYRKKCRQNPTLYKSKKHRSKN